MGVADEASVNSAIDYVIKQHKRPRYVEYDLIGDEMMSILYQCHRNWRPQRNRMARTRRQGALDLIGAFGLREMTGRGRYKG